MDSWQLVVSPRLSGAENMRFDLELFNDFEAGKIPSTLRIYSWQPKCISVGYSQDLVSKAGWDVVKRPTGGGIVYHDEGEIAYSIVTAIDDPMLPPGLMPSYKKISEAIIYALKTMGIEAKLQTANPKPQNKSQPKKSNHLCFSTVEEYEIVVGNKKIVGSAQKRGSKALLQQGAIKPGQAVEFEAMAAALTKGFKNKLGIKFDHEDL